jgi:hypothetical protein
MKKLLMMLMTSIVSLLVLVSCEESKEVKNITKTEGAEAVDQEKDINALVTIKEAVNKEGLSLNGDKVQYIYEVPIINIDKPGAQKVNDQFLKLEKDMERRIGDGQNMTLFVKSKAFVNDGIISVVMEIKKTGPGGIYVVNYDIENDKEITTKELLEKYKFDPQKLIAEINRQVKINESKPEEEPASISIDLFVDTVIANMYDQNDYLKKLEELQNKTKEEKERYVIENIDKLKVYINNDGKFVFIHSGVLVDEELVVE